MVRPDRTAAQLGGGSCCIELAGASPAAVSAGAPRSRPRAWEEILPPEWGVESPQRVVRRVGGEQVRRPSVSEPYSPVTLHPKGRAGRAAHFPAKATDCTSAGGRSPPLRSGAGRPRGREEGMRTQFGAEQERPVPAARSGEGGPYKPTVKGDRAGRESEGPIVPW